MPRRISRTSLLEHLIDRLLILIPFLTVSPVLIRDLPLFLRIVLTVIKPRKLCILVDLNPEFDDHSSPVGQFFLKFVHFIVRTFPVVFAAESFQTFHHDTAIPGAVKNCDMTVLWKSRPETPQIMAGFFVWFRAGDRMHLVSAWIKCTCDSLDISTLAGSIPSFVCDDHRDPFAVETVMEFT